MYDVIQIYVIKKHIRPPELIMLTLLYTTVQGKPKNRKLPFFRLSICKIIHAGREGQFPIFGYSLYCDHMVAKCNAYVNYKYVI